MSSTTPTSFTGKKLRKRRERLGLSIEGLAYKAGISYKTIERLEAGGVQPRKATIAVIEAAFAEVEAERAAA